jgi:hypothetical protein
MQDRSRYVCGYKSERSPSVPTPWRNTDRVPAGLVLGDAPPRATADAVISEVFRVFQTKFRTSRVSPGYRTTTNRIANKSEEYEPMKTNYKPALAVLNRWKFKECIICTALVSLAAGSLVTAGLMPPNQVGADSNRVFQLMIYHASPGKVPALESLFRDVSTLQAKHDLNVIGYWVPNVDPAWSNTFIYLVAHSNRDEAKKNWEALHADPAFPEYRKQAAQLIEKENEEYRVDEVYMRPTDYSAMK